MDFYTANETLNTAEVLDVATMELLVRVEATGEELDPTQVIERFEVRGLPDTIDPALFPAIAEGEMKGDIGYQKWADAETDPEVQRLLRLNGREETKHAERLARVSEILGVS